MPVCAVNGCRETGKLKVRYGRVISFHQFPDPERSPTRHKQWVDFCQAGDLNTKKARICSRHFKLSDFARSDLFKLKYMPEEKHRKPALNRDAIPSIFKVGPTALKVLKEEEAAQEKKNIEKRKKEIHRLLSAPSGSHDSYDLEGLVFQTEKPTKKQQKEPADKQNAHCSSSGFEYKDFFQTRGYEVIQLNEGNTNFAEVRVHETPVVFIGDTFQNSVYKKRKLAEETGFNTSCHFLSSDSDDNEINCCSELVQCELGENIENVDSNHDHVGKPPEDAQMNKNTPPHANITTEKLDSSWNINHDNNDIKKEPHSPDFGLETKFEAQNSHNFQSLENFVISWSSILQLFAVCHACCGKLPFSMTASLNGVHMFCNSQGSELKNVFTEDTTVVWKVLEESITLIAVGVCTQESILNELLEFVFSALVMIVGIEEIKMPRSTERLKRDLRISYPLLDRLMECIDLGNQSLGSSDILSLVPVVFTSENSLLLNCLEVWTEVINSQFGCVVIENSIAAATPAWWELDPHERKLLQLLILSSSGVTATDIPVFLPQKSPSVPFRLVSCMLVSGVWVSALCGPAPNLSQIERLTAECWKHVTEVLKSVCSVVPRNFPQTLTLQQGIMGFLLINIPFSKYVMSNTVTNNKKESRSHGDVLRTFYYESARLLAGQDGEDAALETYWCSEYHKVYAIRIIDEIICVLFSSNIPTSTMRIITKETHSLLTSDKHFCW